MRKTVVIGDVHGRRIWEEIVKKEDGADFVFVGDYFDSFDISPLDQITNFNAIVAFRESYKGSCTLLLGNHDYHYLRGVRETYGGYSAIHSFDISMALEEAIKKDYIKVAHAVRNDLITHAGVTKTWLERVGVDVEGSAVEIALDLNMLLHHNLFHFEFVHGGDNQGNNIFQGPLWVRPESLIKDLPPNVDTQIFGHTQQYSMLFDFNTINVDTLDAREYLIMKDFFTVGKI